MAKPKIRHQRQLIEIKKTVLACQGSGHYVLYYHSGQTSASLHNQVSWGLGLCPSRPQPIPRPEGLLKICAIKSKSGRTFWATQQHTEMVSALIC